VFLKALHPVQYYKQELPDAPLPPEPVPKRLGTWIEAVNFYSEHFETAKSVIAKLPCESALSAHGSQSAFSNPKVCCLFSYIRSSFGWLPEGINHLEMQWLPLQESMDIMKNEIEKLSVVKGEADESVSPKLQVV
jgi:hypothetical protein